MKEFNNYIKNNYDKIIGWGASKYYKQFSPLLDIEVEYLIDSDSNKWGKRIDNKIIHSPSVLYNENPNKTLIIIFSSYHDDIYESIKEYGDFYCISGKGLISFTGLLKYGNRNIMKNTEDQKEVVLSISKENFMLYISGACKFMKEQMYIMNKNNYINLHIFWEKYNIKKYKGIYLTVIKNGEELGLYSIKDFFSQIKNIKAIIIHNLIQMNLYVLDIILDLIGDKIPVLYYIHDFSCLCSSIKLLYNNKNFCKAYANGWKKCLNCDNRENREKIFSYHCKLFKRKNVNIICPSNNTKDIICKSFDLSKESVKVISHQKYNLVSKKQNKINDKIRIAYVGYKDVNKGWEVFKKLVLEFKGIYEFYCLGESDEIIDGVKYVSVSFIKEGKNAMVKKIKENSIDISLLWSLWPETYSYTYYESYAAGTFVITNYMSGNIADQVRINKNGVVLKNYEELSCLLKDEEKLRRLISKNNKMIENLVPNDDFIKLISGGYTQNG